MAATTEVGLSDRLSSLLAENDGRPLAHYVALPGSLSRATMVRAIRTGALRAVRYPTGYRVTEGDFALWIASRRSDPRRVGVSDDLVSDDLVAQIVSAAPELSAERAARIARVVGGASA